MPIDIIKHLEIVTTSVVLPYYACICVVIYESYLIFYRAHCGDIAYCTIHFDNMIEHTNKILRHC